MTQRGKPANKVPTVNLLNPAPNTPKPVSAQLSAMQMALAQAQHRAMPDINVEPLPKDSDFIAPSKLRGVKLLIMNAESEEKDWGNGPKPQIVYTYWIVAREDLGKRKAALGNRQAVPEGYALLEMNLQAITESGNGIFPFLATFDSDNPGDPYSPITLRRWNDSQASREYYHAPLGEVDPRDKDLVF